MKAKKKSAEQIPQAVNSTISNIESFIDIVSICFFSMYIKTECKRKVQWKKSIARQSSIGFAYARQGGNETHSHLARPRSLTRTTLRILQNQKRRLSNFCK